MPDKTPRKPRKRPAKTASSSSALARAEAEKADQYIGNQLKAMYDAVAVEPVPDRLLQLLDRLDDVEQEPSHLGRERGGHDELDAGMTGDDFQRSVQLFGKRAHHAGAQALSLCQIRDLLEVRRLRREWRQKNCRLPVAAMLTHTLPAPWPE